MRQFRTEMYQNASGGRARSQLGHAHRPVAAAKGKRKGSRKIRGQKERKRGSIKGYLPLTFKGSDAPAQK